MRRASRLTSLVLHKYRVHTFKGVKPDQYQDVLDHLPLENGRRRGGQGRNSILHTPYQGMCTSYEVCGSLSIIPHAPFQGTLATPPTPNLKRSGNVHTETHGHVGTITDWTTLTLPKSHLNPYSIYTLDEAVGTYQDTNRAQTHSQTQIADTYQSTTP